MASARLDLLHALDLSLSEAGLVALIAGYTALFCEGRDPDQGDQLTIAAARADAVPIVNRGPPQHEVKVDALNALNPVPRAAVAAARPAARVAATVKGALAAAKRRKLN